MLTDRSEPPATGHEPLPERPLAGRVVALLEVILCSGYPTQLALAATLAALGYGPFEPSGQLRLGYVFWLLVADSLLIVGLVWLFLRAQGEHPRDVLIGRRPAADAVLGLPLSLVAFAVGIGVLLMIARYAPTLHTVARNPLEALFGSTRDAWVFGLVVLLAGGIREEIQRAFLLHRFDAWLGGAPIGIVFTSIAFGLGHRLQGDDAAIATGLLGCLWGVVYVWRRSAVAPLVSHTGFNLLQIAQLLLAR